MPSHPVITVLHPGAMGAAVAACLGAGGHRVRWPAEGRSPASAARAAAAGLDRCETLADALAGTDIVLCVCPPEAALDTARSVASLGFDGLYVDANAVSPASAAAIARTVGGAGARFVDGGIVGPPPAHPGTTRLYLSGERAGEVAACFAGSALEAVVLDGPATAASALKMCYAAWTKGSAALLMSVAALARAEGVEHALEAEWAHSLPGLAAQLADDTTRNAPKAWRFVAEMREIAATFGARRLPEGYHLAAAETYAALAPWRDAPAPDADAVLAALAAPARAR